MGKEIPVGRFYKQDFKAFEKRLATETELLGTWFQDNKFAQEPLKGGFELEAWLVNKHCRPAPINDQFLESMADDLVVPELAKFNIELNGNPQVLRGHALRVMEKELDQTWNRCVDVASRLDIDLVAIGILPTVRGEDLILENISSMKRFRALNEQVLRLRQGQPLTLDIKGQHHLRTSKYDLMLEACATSFQIHIQVGLGDAVRCYNSSLIISAPMVAATANSPYLFGKDLWDETRIPLFEQAVATEGHKDSPCGPIGRVSFGTGYVQQSLFAMFVENIECFPVLLPVSLDSEIDRLAHVRLQNGTIWRWNRPLIGFSNAGAPHLRIEHRVVPAGPTVIDSMANAAFYFGLVQAFCMQASEPTERIKFEKVHDNFYSAAKHGLRAKITWLDGEVIPINTLLIEELCPMARQGLQALQISADDIDRYMGLIETRIRTGRNGAGWQRAYVAKHGDDRQALTAAYLENQRSGEAVHEWPIMPIHYKGTQGREILTVVNDIPDQFLEVQSERLHEVLGGPTLIHLPGKRPEPLFVSILQHGNENTGLSAIQALLRNYHGKELPRALSIFVGNVAAARYRCRNLAGQPDYNRIWSGDGTAEHKMMRQVVSDMRDRKVFASIDVHNNTGTNPLYACVNKLEQQFLQLATLFGRVVVYFVRPEGVQSMAFAEFCPAVTLECGQPGQKYGIERAQVYLDNCLNLDRISDQALNDQDIDLYHTVAIVKVPQNVSFGFGATDSDIRFIDGLDQLNFSEIPTNTTLGWLNSNDQPHLEVWDEHDAEINTRYFKYDQKEIRTIRPVTPSMLTQDERIIRQDCLCYLMERITMKGVTLS